MRKILVIALREYKVAVLSKGFLVGLIMMPVMMLGGMAVPALFKDRIDMSDQRVVVLDRTGKLFPMLQQAAESRNETSVFDSSKSKQIAPKYVFEVMEAEPTESLLLELSDRVRRRDIYGFVEIPESVLQMDAPPAPVAFYGENTTLSDLRRWLQLTIDQSARTQRFASSGVGPEVVAQANRAVPLEGRRLLERTRDGGIKNTGRSDPLATVLMPGAVMLLMFMIIFMAAQPALESVMEEKQNRIAEVLLGSITSTQLMLGKLLGGVAGSLTLVTIYISGALSIAIYYDYWSKVPLHILPWFLVYQVLAVLLFSALFMAVGAAANTLKDAQGLLMPIWMLIVLPIMLWFNIVREPNGPLATWLSFFPPATPLIMTLRMAASSLVPWWQPLLGVILVLLTTVIIVAAAGRIFGSATYLRVRRPNRRNY